MEPYPPSPSVDEVDDGHLAGHLWIRELPESAAVRFAVTDAGLVFGDRERRFEPWEEPPAYRPAATDVRERFRTEAFRETVDDPGAYTFVGRATGRATVPYDLDALPAFVGLDVHGPDRGWYPPDGVERAFDRLGLRTAAPVERELPARDFHPDRYGPPDSAWYDGPAVAVAIRDKRGARARLSWTRGDGTGTDPVDDRPDPAASAPEEFAERVASPDRVAAAADRLRERGAAASVDAVARAILYRAIRESFDAYRDLDADAFDRLQSAVAERVNRELNG